MPSCEQSCEFALICKGHRLLASLKVLSQRARVGTLLNWAGGVDLSGAQRPLVATLLSWVGDVELCGAVEAETMSGMAAGYEQAPAYPAHPQVQS